VAFQEVFSGHYHLILTAPYDNDMICSISPECPRLTARLQRSAGGISLSLWWWSSNLFRGQPGHLQLGSRRRPSDRSMWHRKAQWSGQVCPLQVWLCI